MEVTVTLPEDLARLAGLSGTKASGRATFLVLLELYRESRLSIGRFAEAMEMSQAELLDRLAEHATYLNYGPEDLEADREAAS